MTRVHRLSNERAGDRPRRIIRTKGMDVVQSKYNFHKQSDGFLIEAVDRTPVCITATPTSIVVAYDGYNRDMTFSPIDIPGIAKCAARGLMTEWRQLDNKPEWHGAHEWARRQTAGTIYSRVREHCSGLAEAMNPLVLQVHKKVFAATYGFGELAFSEELYNDNYIVSDILRYPAAAVACRYIEELRLEREMSSLSGPALAKGYRIDGLTPMGDFDQTRAALESLGNWMSLFSITGGNYTSLNRTLMNLPRGVPGKLLVHLNKIRLCRPITDRIELIAAIAGAPYRSQRLNEVCLHARRDQIIRSVRLVQEHIRQPISLRRASGIGFAIRFVDDCPERYNGNLVGRTKNAIRWHTQDSELRSKAIAEQLGRETATAKPPIALPDMAGVRFLEAVGEVCDEGAGMAHCLASYAERAVSGSCYLFHIEHGDESASVQVSRYGRVVQSHGPRNRPNKAAEWGKRVLNRWGRNFPEIEEVSPFEDEELFFYPDAA
jgi:hypothetical protein